MRGITDWQKVCSPVSLSLSAVIFILLKTHGAAMRVSSRNFVVTAYIT